MTAAEFERKPGAEATDEELNATYGAAARGYATANERLRAVYELGRRDATSSSVAAEIRRATQRNELHPLVRDNFRLASWHLQRAL